ncbi:MAG: MarR family winged helix-turn-helix transcriptional regulator [Casimicrobiaceae bacterium]
MSSPARQAPRRRGGVPAADVAAVYVARGTECAYANMKLVSRVLGTVYDEMLRPVDLRASQLALMWAIAALEPVELGRLGRVTMTDQTTLSRTVEKLRAARLVSVRHGVDRRVRVLRLTARGRRRFAEAMPLWEVAQQRASELLPLEQVRSLARRVRRAARALEPAEA